MPNDDFDNIKVCESSTRSDEYRKFDFTSNYILNSDKTADVYVSIRVDYLTDPVIRETDILQLGYGSLIFDKVLGSDIAFTSKLSYNHSINNYNSLTNVRQKETVRETVEITGKDYDKYNIYENKTLSIAHELPADKYKHEFQRGYEYQVEETYSDFVLTCDIHLKVTQEVDMIKLFSLHASYIHICNNINFDIDKVLVNGGVGYIFYQAPFKFMCPKLDSIDSAVIFDLGD